MNRDASVRVHCMRRTRRAGFPGFVRDDSTVRDLAEEVHAESFPAAAGVCARANSSVPCSVPEPCMELSCSRYVFLYPSVRITVYRVLPYRLRFVYVFRAFVRIHCAPDPFRAFCLQDLRYIEPLSGHSFPYPKAPFIRISDDLLIIIIGCVQDEKRFIRETSLWINFVY